MNQLLGKGDAAFASQATTSGDMFLEQSQLRVMTVRGGGALRRGPPRPLVGNARAGSILPRGQYPMARAGAACDKQWYSLVAWGFRMHELARG